MPINYRPSSFSGGGGGDVTPASGTNELSHAGLSANIEGTIAAPDQAFATSQNAHQMLLKDSGMMGLSHITPGVESAALAAPPMPGAESAIAGALPGAMPGAEQISPIIQMIMRMPGHIGLMNSFFEWLSQLFLPAHDMIAGVAGGLDLSAFAQQAHAAMGTLASSAGEHMAINPSLLPPDAPIFKTMGIPQANSSSLLEHSSLLPRHGLNVSGNLDLSKAQFEGAGSATSGIKSSLTGRSDLLSGPHMSADANTANHLSAGTRLFGGDKLSTSFSGNNITASSNIPTAGTVPNAMSGMNVGASLQDTSALSGPGLSNSVGSHLGSIGRSSIDGSAIGPSGAVSNSLGGKNLLAMDSYQPTMGADRIVPDAPPSNDLLPKDSTSSLPGLKAKQLSLEGIKGAHAHVPKPSVSHASHTPSAHHQPTLSKASQFKAPAMKHPDAARVEAAHAQAKAVDQVQAPTDQTTATTDGTQIGDATATDATADYTVQPGDNLWDIAKAKLGDGFRWQEIYNLNKDLVGVNPDLIQPGTTLHLPTDQIASATTDATKYVVQPGDNLWQIAQDHLGGGEHWNEIFQANSQTIGSNPDLIHPGTELSLPGAGGAQVASAVPAATPTIDPSVAMQQAPMQPTTAAVPDGYGMPAPDAAAAPVAQPVVPSAAPEAVAGAGSAQAAPVMPQAMPQAAPQVMPQAAPGNPLVSSSLKPDLSFLKRK